MGCADDLTPEEIVLEETQKAAHSTEGAGGWPPRGARAASQLSHREKLYLLSNLETLHSQVIPCAPLPRCTS